MKKFLLRAAGWFIVTASLLWVVMYFQGIWMIYSQPEEQFEHAFYDAYMYLVQRNPSPREFINYYRSTWHFKTGVSMIVIAEIFLRLIPYVWKWPKVPLEYSHFLKRMIMAGTPLLLVDWVVVLFAYAQGIQAWLF